MIVAGTSTAADIAAIHALRSREAGYAVAKKCLEVQAEREALDPSLRSEHGVRLHPDARSWYVGALGEIEVGGLLAGLGTDWLVLHSVPIGSATTDVDHLLIGPPGVFAINAKHHRGGDVWIGDQAEKVGNHVQRYARNSLNESRNVAARLGRATDAVVAVNPVVVIVGARRIKDSRSPEGRSVSFVPADDVVRWLLSLEATLSPAELGLLRLAAENPRIWHSDPHAAETTRIMRRFDRLCEEVERHRLWAASAPDRRAWTASARGPRSGSASDRRPASPRAPRPPRASTRRVVATVVLLAIALAVAIPTTVLVAGFAARYPNEFRIGMAVVLGFLGLAAGSGTTKRRSRR